MGNRGGGGWGTGRNTVPLLFIELLPNSNLADVVGFPFVTCVGCAWESL